MVMPNLNSSTGPGLGVEGIEGENDKEGDGDGGAALLWPRRPRRPRRPGAGGGDELWLPPP
jgi:hypothetical protein